MLSGHRSGVRGIIRINEDEIISGEWRGDLRLWRVSDGTCSKYINGVQEYGFLYQLKSYNNTLCICRALGVIVYELGGDNNNLGTLNNKLLSLGCSIEFISQGLLLRGGVNYLEIIDLSLSLDLDLDLYFKQGDNENYYLPLNLNSSFIWDMLRITHNIVIMVTEDGSMMVLDPIARICHLRLKNINSAAVRALVRLY